MTKQEIFWILVCGHGGVAFHYYLTAGKRSPQVPPGIYEGEFNRRLAAAIARLYGNPERCIIWNPGPVDIGNSNKITAANKLYTALDKPKMVYLDLNANAARGKGWSDANGRTIFHHPRSKGGKILAEKFNVGLNDDFISSRGIKTSRWMESLWRTRMTALLIENGFMTNMDDAVELASNYYIEDILAPNYVRIMKECEGLI